MVSLHHFAGVDPLQNLAKIIPAILNQPDVFGQWLAVQTFRLGDFLGALGGADEKAESREVRKIPEIQESRRG